MIYVRNFACYVVAVSFFSLRKSSEIYYRQTNAAIILKSNIKFNLHCLYELKCTYTEWSKKNDISAIKDLTVQGNGMSLEMCAF